jgi:sulfide:quinone oxidoreductase
VGRGLFTGAGYAARVAMRVTILGAGFGGLELSTLLSEQLGEQVEVTLIDRGESFVFGFSKLDVLFGRATAEAVRLPYREIVKPGVRFLRQTVSAIDPASKTVTTDGGEVQADALVIALGADYAMDATPGLAEHGNEFYSVAGAERLAETLPRFSGGRVIVGVCGAPFKCPPAPSEAALLLHDHLLARGLRGDTEISFVIPLPTPVPPSPETSAALEAAFAERDIAFVPGRRVASLDGARHMAVLDDGSEMPYDLFMGVPKHRAPDVLFASGMVDDVYVPVDSRTLQTRHPDVYAIGDCADVGVPKAGVFAERAARAVASALVARARGEGEEEPYDGRGSCYIEFGGGQVGRVDVDFLSGPKPTGEFQAPSLELVEEKRHFGASRAARWFGR